MGKQAILTEIFSSIQGEGTHTGEKMTFVRFSGCTLSCKWCDTSKSLSDGSYRVETPEFSKKFVNYSNPVSVEKLNEHLKFFTEHTISITGGEPLEHIDFLEEWLPTVHPEKRILLETNGIYPDFLTRIVKHVDIVSMDLKLPSSSGAGEYWNQHKEFLSTSLKFSKETYIKIVVTEDTTDIDLNNAIKLVTSVNRFVPLILQPVWHESRFKISSDRLASIFRLCSSWLPNVSIMKQLHKELGIL